MSRLDSLARGRTWTATEGARRHPGDELDARARVVEAAERKAKDMLAQVDAYRALSSNLAHDDA
jgi:hypothetical protein